MTWLGQVLHVARKDVLEEAWPLVAYLAVTALAAVVVFVQPALGYSAVFAFMVFLLGMILTAAAVQSDSPTASESFWGSRPFRPTAILGAKVLLAAIIVLVPSIAQAVALLAFRTSGGEAVIAIADSAREYALWLLAAMVIAGLTRDVRTFIVALATIFVALTLALAISTDLWSSLAPPTPMSSAQAIIAQQRSSVVGPVLWTITAVSSAVALLAFVYRRRDARRRIWIVAIAVVVGAASASFNSTPGGVHAATTASIPIRVELLRSDRAGKDEQMSFRAAVDTDTVSRRLILAVDRVIVHLKDGTDVTVGGNEGSSALVAAGNPFAANVRWLRTQRDRLSLFALTLSFDQRSAISKGFTGLELVGTVFRFEPRVIGVLPLEANRSLMRGGTRLRIVNATPAPDGGTVAVQATSLPRPPSLLLASQLAGNYALVNEARGEMVYPSRGAGGSPLTMLVLPSMPLTDDHATLQLKSSDSTGPDGAWFIGARLALVEWMPRGQYDVRVPVVEVPTNLAQSPRSP